MDEQVGGPHCKSLSRWANSRSMAAATGERHSSNGTRRAQRRFFKVDRSRLQRRRSRSRLRHRALRNRLVALGSCGVDGSRCEMATPHRRPVLDANDEAVHGDLVDVRGQLAAKRALEIAAAGGHNLLWSGRRGAGKRCWLADWPSILPPMSLHEALEVTKIYSIAGLLVGRAGIVRARPFRFPHHTISQTALVGGGALVKPGEISLAHHGVLFLDRNPYTGFMRSVNRRQLIRRAVFIRPSSARASGSYSRVGAHFLGRLSRYGQNSSTSGRRRMNVRRSNCGGPMALTHFANGSRTLATFVPEISKSPLLLIQASTFSLVPNRAEIAARLRAVAFANRMQPHVTRQVRELLR